MQLIPGKRGFCPKHLGCVLTCLGSLSSAVPPLCPQSGLHVLPCCKAEHDFVYGQGFLETQLMEFQLEKVLLLCSFRT